MKSVKKIALAASVAVACAVRAEEYTVESGTELTVPEAGISFSPGGALRGWRCPFSPKGRVNMTSPGTYAFRMFAGEMLPTGEPAPSTAVFEGVMRLEGREDGSLSVAYSIVPDRDVDLETFHLGATLRADLNGGGTVAGDGQPPVTMPETMRRDAHFFVRTVTDLAIEGRAGRSRIGIRLPRAAPVLMQDNRKWGTWDFTLRIPIAASPLKKGVAYSASFVLSGRSPMVKSETDGRYVIEPGKDWVPLAEEPDIAAGSALDFSDMRGTGVPAGRYGYALAKGDHFEFEKLPGVKQRFWGVNVCMKANVPEKEVARRFAERLARLGYNSVRIHHHESQLVTPDGKALDAAKMDRFDALVAACISNGLYLTTDVFVSRQPIPFRSIGIDRDGSVPVNDFKELVLFHEGAFEELKDWARKFLGHVNPYTGRSLAVEPALSFLSLVNEGNAGNRGMAIMRRYPEVARQWRTWLAEKKREFPDRFGTVPETLPETLNDRESVHQAAYTLFLKDVETRFCRRMRTFLREELKCRAALADMNGWHFPAAHMFVRGSEHDYVDDHFYEGHPQWMETLWHLPARCPNFNPLKFSGRGVWDLSYRRSLDKPFAVSEFGYPAPNSYRAVGGLLTGAQAGLQDWSALWHFAWAHDALGLEAPERKRMDFFNLCGDPLTVAAGRAATCLYLRGDVEPLKDAYAIVMDASRLKDDPRGGWLWHTVSWGWAAWYAKIGFTTKGDAPGMKWSASYPEAYSRPSEAVRKDLFGDASAPLPSAAGDGQVAIDSGRGAFTVMTPKTAGGFAETGVIDAGTVKAALSGSSAAVWASSLDDRPIGRSERLLVTHLTDLQNTGLTFADKRSTILLEWGCVPHLLRAGRAELEVAVPKGLWTVWALSTGGRRVREVPSAAEDGRLRFTADVAADPVSATFLYEIVRRADPRATVTVDFGAETGRLNRRLHGAGYAPRLYGCSIHDNTDEIKSMKLTATRTHDWALHNCGQRMVDTHFIFPLMKLDPKDPSNYFFGPTDEILKRARATGMEVLYRIGTSIEHTGNVHFNILVPEDFGKYAEIAAGIVRHYNSGWANGHEWGIRYWEIWNEPDGITNSWGGNGEDPAALRRKFLTFFVTVLKRLKAEFPDIKVGGAAFTWWADDYTAALLEACKAAGVAPDFVSWHCYTDKPEVILEMPRKARALCDAAGFPDVELVMDEWHYMHDWMEFLGFDNGKSRRLVPGKSDRAFLGPSGHLNIDSAAYNLYVLAKLQDTPLDQAYYYGYGYDGGWGYADGNNRGTFNKTYYSMTMHGDLIADFPRRVACTSTGGTVAALAALSEDGRRGCLLVSDYRGTAERIAVASEAWRKAKNLKVEVLDNRRNRETVRADVVDGVLTLPKEGSGSAAFLITFDCERGSR